MTEDADKSYDEMASDFIVGTCQLLPKSFSPVSDQMHNLMLTNTPRPKSKEYSITCGSTAEFYILPLNTCIDDIDILICSANELAFSGDFPALPSDISGLSDTIECYKIESYHRYPGYVRLQILVEMIYNWKYKRYIFNLRDLTNSYKTLNMATLATEYAYDITYSPTSQRIVNGPAITLQSDGRHSLGDVVRSVWCPQWPREAQKWPLRPRNYRWPNIDTISKVTQNGCHVVFAQHRNCKDDREQWRFSFSFAEVILLQSWTKIQQIVYHLLRFFAKRELIQKNCPKEDEILCTYHLKTLMLWTCEEIAPEWWNSLSVISVCCELLNKLSKWIKRRNIPNYYFIPEANLFHEPSRTITLNKIVGQINKSCNSDVLCRWFVGNYIVSFISTHLLELPDLPVEYTAHAMIRFLDCTALSDLLEFRRKSELTSLNLLLNFTFQECHYYCRLVVRIGSNSGLRDSMRSVGQKGILNMKGRSSAVLLQTIENDLCFTYYDNLLHILHGVYGLS